MSISRGLIFHLDGLDSPVEAWEKLIIFFGLKNEIQSYQLENQLFILDPSNFSSIQDFLCRFKTLRFLLEDWKVKKEEDNLIYGIISNLGPIYYLFVFTFHSTREVLLSSGTKYKSPSFDAFYDSLIRE